MFTTTAAWTTRPSWGVTWADATHLFVSNSDIKGQLSLDGGQTFGFGYTGHTLTRCTA